jgi:hypothetical protein
MIPGPERVTLIERLAGVFRLPYMIGCLVISLIIGPPGAIVLAYITTGFDIEKALTLTIALFAGVGIPFWTGIGVLALLWLFLFYVFYMTRFMRQRMLLTEQDLHPVLPEGEKTFHEAFHWVAKHWPPIAIAIAIIAFYFLSSAEALLQTFDVYAVQMANIIYIIVVYPIWLLIFATFAWVYLSSIHGLYKLGRKPLTLRPSVEDRMFGVKPFGNLSLSLSIVYFLAMAILIMITITEAVGSSESVGITFIILLVTFSTVGVMLFIAPLYTVHKRMVEQKEKERLQLHSQIYKSVEGTSNTEGQDTVAGMKRRLDNIASVMALDMAEKNLNSIPNWPIDTPIISRFATIILSVIAILMANLILQFFRL